MNGTNTGPTQRIPARRTTIDEYHTDLATLPRRVQDYILFDAPRCLDPVSVRASLERGFGLDAIKAAVARDTLDVYGKDYPL